MSFDSMFSSLDDIMMIDTRPLGHYATTGIIKPFPVCKAERFSKRLLGPACVERVSLRIAGRLAGLRVGNWLKHLEIGPYVQTMPSESRSMHVDRFLGMCYGPSSKRW